MPLGLNFEPIREQNLRLSYLKSISFTQLLNHLQKGVLFGMMLKVA